MEWKNDAPAVRMNHLNMAAFAMDFDEDKTLQSRQDLTAGQERRPHNDSSTTSREASSSG